MNLRRRAYLSEGQAPTDIILQQLGGSGRLWSMIGAKDFMSDNGGKTLRFKFPNRSKSKPNMIKITLTSMDLYDMEFGRTGMKKDPNFPIKSPSYTKMKTIKGVYDDMLKGIFEKETGLRLSL